MRVVSTLTPASMYLRIEKHDLFTGVLFNIYLHEGMLRLIMTALFNIEITSL